MKRRNVIFSGGGTAGHLHPGLVVSGELKQRDPEIQITFVGGGRSLEKDIAKHYGVQFIPLAVQGLKGKGLRIIKSLFILPLAFIKSFYLLMKFRPRLVIGLGGYSSGPIVLLAAFLRIPTLILEQNLRPGFTNRMLRPWIRKAVVSFEGSLPYFKGKALFLGNPTRRDFNTIQPKEREKRLAVLIFGGSQGSHFLNKQITQTLPLLMNKIEVLYIFHQTGEKDFEWVKECYTENGFKNVELSPYFLDMPHYFKKSDLVVCRAGATTVAELIASQKAALLIPFAQATDNHQVLNAQELAKVGGAEILEESEFTPQHFYTKIVHFINHKEDLDRMEKNIKELKKENIAERISDLCQELMTGSHEEVPT